MRVGNFFSLELGRVASKLGSSVSWVRCCLEKPTDTESDGVSTDTGGVEKETVFGLVPRKLEMRRVAGP